MSPIFSNRRLRLGMFAGAGLALVAAVFPQSGVGASAPTTLPARVIDSATAARNKPDDIAVLDGHVFVGFQNGIGPDGTPGSLGADSTIVEYGPHGQELGAFHVVGKVDGLTADPAGDRLIGTVNEDLNSGLFVLRPHRDDGPRLVRFTYDPSPAEATSSTPPLAGGTDSIAILRGHIYVVHSNPATAGAAAMYESDLDPATHIAHLRSVFADNATAVDAVTHLPVTLALTDPDTNLVMPAASPRYAGRVLQVAQADGQLIFADEPAGHHPRLTRLALSQPSAATPTVNDVAVATADEGTLYVTDTDVGTVIALSTHGLPRGTVFVAETKDTGSPLVGTLDLTTGQITPLANVFDNPHGLLFIAR